MKGKCICQCEGEREGEECKGLRMIERMIDEAHRESLYSTIQEDRLMIMSKRDALSELAMRIRHGKENHLWVRLSPAWGSKFPL